MASIRTKFTVGVFVAIGLVIAIAAIVWLGMSNYFQKGLLYAAYFDESVQGLTKDSPVKYRGVSIGRVDSIGVAPDANLIQVILKIETGLRIEADLIEGLVARLKTVGITGIMFIELERKGPGEPNLSPTLTFTPRYPVIATKPSDIRKIIQGLDEVLNQVRELDIRGITDRIKTTLDTINQTVADTQAKEISAEIRELLAKTDQLFGGTDLGSLTRSFQKAGNLMTDLIGDAAVTFKRLDRMISENEQRIHEALGHFSHGMNAADTALTRLDAIVAQNETDVRDAVRGLKKGVGLAEKTAAQLDRIVSDSEEDMKAVLDHLKNGMQAADQTLNRLHTLVAENETVVSDMLKALHRTLNTADVALSRVDRFISTNEKGFSEAVDGFSRSMKSADLALKRLEALVADNEPDVREALVAFRQAMEHARSFMESGKNLMEGSDDKITQLQRHLIVTLQNLEKATDNLNRFVESISDRPSQLFFGQPPQTPKFERDRFD